MNDYKCQVCDRYFSAKWTLDAIPRNWRCRWCGTRRTPDKAPSLFSFLPADEPYEIQGSLADLDGDYHP